MQVTKAAEAVNHGVPNPVQMAAINALAKAQLEPEQVYVFSLRLCDDQVDRDFERFDTMALPELARLFRGKTGIVDHCWSAENQIARISRPRWFRRRASATSRPGPISAGVRTTTA